MTLIEWFDRFIEDRALYGLSARTMEAYNEFVRPFVAFVGESLSPEELTTDGIKAYIAHISNRKLSKATTATYIRHIRVFLNWLSNEASTSYNLSKVPMPRVPKKQVHIYTDDEIRTIYMTIQATPEWIRLRNCAAISLMLDTGLRRHEVCTVETAKLDRHEKIMTVVGKGEKTRTVPIGKLSLKFIEAYRKVCPFDTSKQLFVGRNGEPLTDNALKQLVSKLAEHLPFEFSCHKLRHNFATNYCLDMYETKGQMDAYSLQIILGHAELQTTMRYIHHAQQIVAARANISHLDRIFDGLPCPI